MISLSEAFNIVRDHFDGVKPKQAYKYGDDYYLIFAPISDSDISTPFYIVGISDGRYRYLNPLEDIDKFNEAIEVGPIKSLI